MYGLLLREAIQHRTEKYTKIRWHVLGHVCPVYTSDTSVYNFKGLRGVWCKSKPLLLLRDLTTHIQKKCALFSRFKVELWYLLGLLEGIISKAFLVTVCVSLTPRREAKSWCIILSIKWIALVFFQFDFHSAWLLQPLQAMREFLDRGSVCRDWPEFQWEAGILQVRWLITWPQASRRVIPHPLRCQNWHPVMNRLKLLWNILNYRSLAATTQELRLMASWAYRKASHILLKSPTLNPLMYFKLALAHDFLCSVKTMKLLQCQNMEFGEI